MWQRGTMWQAEHWSKNEIENYSRNVEVITECLRKCAEQKIIDNQDRNYRNSHIFDFFFLVEFHANSTTKSVALRVQLALKHSGQFHIHFCPRRPTSVAVKYQTKRTCKLESARTNTHLYTYILTTDPGFQNLNEGDYICCKNIISSDSVEWEHKLK